MKVQDANVLVTGASSGIGAALALMLAEQGATVGLVARREDRLAKVLERCLHHAPGSRMWVADLGDTHRAAELALQAWDEMGGLDVLVNNAAIPRRRPVQVLSIDEIRVTMDVNFEAPVRMSLAVLPRMVARDSGMIVNVSSFGGRAGIVKEAAYCASKFALCGWSEAMAMDLFHTGVEVRLILPGAIDTEIWDQPNNDEAAYRGPLEPPETVAAAIIDAIEGDTFEVYVPDMRAIIEWKTAGGFDEFMAGAVAFADEANRGPI